MTEVLQSTNPSKKQIIDDIYTGETQEENPSKNRNNVSFQPFHEFIISQIYKWLTNSSEVSPNYFLNFFSVWAIENEEKFLIGPKQFFFSLPAVKEIIINIR